MSRSVRISDWVHLKRLRLYFFLQRTAAAKALSLKQLCSSLLDAEIRYLQSDLPQYGEDERLDLAVDLVARHLVGREMPAELDAARQDSRTAELLETAKKSSDVLRVVARYHATDAFLASILKDEARRDSQIGLARAALAGHPEFDAGVIYKEYGKTARRHASLRSELADRTSLKLVFSISGIASSLGLVTAIFVVAGFLQVHYFYRRMGVDVALYFSATDYLAASVELIRAGAFAAALGLAVFAIGARTASLRSRLQNRAVEGRFRKETWLVATFTSALCASDFYFIYIGKPEFSQLRLTGQLLSLWAADYVSKTFFKNHLVAMASISTILVFGVHIGVGGYERSEALLSGKSIDAIRLQVHFKDPTPPVNGEFFGANGSYFFFYARDTGMTHVVPKDRVAQFDISKKGP